eukprot:CAMPEP_0114674484 /NCGR_PEP_ID=MMETSP0191-20121206/46375_1 /TAXON_ID=126664 /ORGANISM="Sorites sp." /LENGTH=62 /DNA_ID=CAMNT_0001941715 /DNA_START=56 /DNA_END=241 /DNA_ORIENTATION=+
MRKGGMFRSSVVLGAALPPFFMRVAVSTTRGTPQEQFLVVLFMTKRATSGEQRSCAPMCAFP